MFNKFNQTALFHNNAIDLLLLVENPQMIQACGRPQRTLNQQKQAFEISINRLLSHFKRVELQTNEAVDPAIKRAIHCAEPGLGWRQGSGQSREQGRPCGARHRTQGGIRNGVWDGARSRARGETRGEAQSGTQGKMQKKHKKEYKRDYMREYKRS